MGDIIDEILADDQFIEHDARAEVQAALEAEEIHVTADRGNVHVIHCGELLYSGRDKDKITVAINGVLTTSPESRVVFDNPGIEGIVYTVRKANGTVSRWFRSDTRSAFYRRKAYANQNPGATVSFHIL